MRKTHNPCSVFGGTEGFQMNKYLPLPLALCLAACSVPFLHQSDQSRSDEIVRLEHSWNKAIRTRDSLSLDRLLAPDFTLASDGRTHGGVPRSVWLSATLRPIAFDTLGSDNIKVSVTGDTARATLRTFWRAKVAGNTMGASARVADLWVKRKGHWQVRSRRVIRRAAGSGIASN
jgi:ketosteroid isomerase-like protein